MQRTEWLMFIATFVFGVFTGFYVYFVWYEQSFANMNFGFGQPDMVAQTGMRVTAEEFGRCETSQTGCALWRLEGNRQYRFIRTDSSGNINESREGLLSQNLFNPLVDELSSHRYFGTLTDYGTQPVGCSGVDSWMRYRIEINEQPTIFIATCGSAEESDELTNRLIAISNTFPI